MPYRTTVSLVFWSDSPEDARALANAAKEMMPAEDRDRALISVEHMEGERPPAFVPPAPPVEPAEEPQPSA